MDVDALLPVVRRAPALAALADGPLDRRDLQERLDVSRPTVHRLTRALEDGGFVERVDGAFALTSLGEVVERELTAFERHVRAARRLADVLPAVTGECVPFDVGAFADATVTRAEPGNPYRPVNRFMELVAGTETLRGMDPASINPLHLDDLHRAIVEGMETDAIYLPSVVGDLLASNPERARSAFESGNLTLRSHGGLPFGLTLCDDRIGIGVYDDDTGLLQVYVDTDDPEARAWAEAVYADYLADAEVLDPPPA